MRSVDLRELEARIVEYVQMAAAGEAVLILDGSRVVAELTPPRGPRSPVFLDAALAGAVRTGLLTPAAFPPAAPPETRPVARLSAIISELDGGRADR